MSLAARSLGLKYCRFAGILSLDTNQLTGRLPSWIGELTKLTALDLSDNSFSGTVPSELASLTDMKVLELYNNELTGDLNPIFCSGNGNGIGAVTNINCDDDAVTCNCCNCVYLLD